MCEKDGYGKRIRAAHDTEREWTIGLRREREIAGRVLTVEGETPAEPIELVFTSFVTPPPPPIEELAGRPRAYEDSEIEALGAWRTETDLAGEFRERVAADELDAHLLTPGWQVNTRQRYSTDRPIEIRIQRVPVLHFFDATTRTPIERVRLLGKETVDRFVRWSGEFEAPDGFLTLPGDAPTTFQISKLADGPEHEVPLVRGDVCHLRGVVHRNGLPCDGAEVALASLGWSDDDCLVDAVRTDGGGGFRLEAGPGDYLLEVMHDGTTYLEPVELPASSALDVDLERTGRIEVEIVDSSGVPRANHVVALRWADRRDETRFTDAEGLTSFAPLPPGPYMVMTPHVTTNGSFRGDVIEELELGRGESRHVRLEIPAFTGERHARVVARGVDRYSDWRARYPYVSSEWQALAEDGTVPMDLTTPATSMEVAAPDARRWLVLLPKEAPDGHLIYLDAGDGSYRGVLFDSEGSPKAGMRIYLDPDAEGDGIDHCPSTITDAVGGFEFLGLQTCVYRFEFRGSSEPFDRAFGAMSFVASQPAFENPRLEIRLVATPKPVRIHGVVRDAPVGKPLADAYVVLECTVPSDSGVLLVGRDHSMTRTDAEGRFEIEVPRTPPARSRSTRAGRRGVSCSLASRRIPDSQKNPRSSSSFPADHRLARRGREGPPLRRDSTIRPSKLHHHAVVGRRTSSSASGVERTSLRVAIVEDETRTRDGLAALITSTDGLRLAGAWPSMEEALPELERDPPAILLADIGLPGINGIEGLRRLRGKHPDVLALMLTVHSEDERVFEAICAGAVGYLLKDTPPERLVEAVRELAAGGAPMSPEIARKVVSMFQRVAPPRASEHRLTEREMEVLQALADGHSYKTAARALSLSIDTIRFHVRGIYAKLHVHSKSEAVLLALRKGLVR